MQILIVSQYFWPENFRINDLTAELVRRGHRVTVLTGYPNYPEGVVQPDFLANPRQFDEFAGARVVRIPMTPRGKGALRLMLNYLTFACSATVLGVWRLRQEKFDAIFGFGASPIMSILPAVVLRRTKRSPLLLWVLDLWPESLSAVGVVKSQRVLSWVGKFVSFIYRRCDLILAQSKAFTPSIAQYAGNAADRIRYFPGWAEGVFRDSPDACVPAVELSSYGDAFKILFAGNVGDAQDLPSVLDAAEELKFRPDILWFIVGDGRGAAYVRQEIARRGLQDRVLMLGRFPLDRMPSFFAAADALLVTLKGDPIISRTIPGKIQSYMGMGVPLLGMLDGEGARVIEESKGGLVSPASDGKGLARNAAALVSMSTTQRAEMGRRARAYGSREFNRDTLIDALENHISEVIERNHM